MNKGDTLLGETIRRIRNAKGVSQSGLARTAGMAQSFVSTVESGHKSPTIRSLQKIAGALGVSPYKLLEGCFNEGNKENI